jgi:hypothetical protein
VKAGGGQRPRVRSVEAQMIYPEPIDYEESRLHGGMGTTYMLKVDEHEFYR